MLQLDEDFEKLEWTRIPETSFLIKYKFKAGYFIIISNLTYVYEEKMNEDDVQERFHVLNPCLEMKTKVILKNLQQCLDDHLRSNKGTILLTRSGHQVDLQLKFDVNEVSSCFEMKLHALPAEKMLKYVFAPLILNACIYKKCFESSKGKEHEKPHDSPLLGTNKNKKSVQLTSELLSSNKVPIETIVESFLEVQGNFYHLLSENHCGMVSKPVTDTKESENDYSSIRSKLCTSRTDERNLSSYVQFKEEDTHLRDSSSTTFKAENNEENPYSSVKIESEASASQHGERKLKKKKINL